MTKTKERGAVEAAEKDVERLEQKIGRLTASRAEARQKAAEAAIEGVDGTAHHHDLPQIDAELVTMGDARDLARQRLVEAIEAERKADLDHARLQAGQAGRRVVAAGDAVDTALRQLEEACAVLDAEIAAYTGAASRAQVPMRAPRLSPTHLAGATLVTAPTFARLAGVERVHHAIRQTMRDTVAGAVLGGRG
jgi:hypothetical protein